MGDVLKFTGDMLTGGAITAGESQSNAIKAQRDMLGAQIAAQQAALEKQLSVTQPYRDFGVKAFSPYMAFAGFDPQTGEYQGGQMTDVEQQAMETGSNALARKLRALGRENSTYGMQTQSDYMRNYLGDIMQNRQSLIGNMLNIGSGAAGVQSGAIGSAGSNMSNAYGTAGGNLANLMMQTPSAGAGLMNTLLNVGSVVTGAKKAGLF